MKGVRARAPRGRAAGGPRARARACKREHACLACKRGCPPGSLRHSFRKEAQKRMESLPLVKQYST